MSRSAIGAKKRSAQQTAEWAVVPSFTGGVNSQAAVTQMRPDEMLYSFNMVPSELGLRTRQGSQEFADSITGTSKTIIPYHAVNDVEDKLFVASDDGIWDVTDGAAASLVFAFPIVTTLAGYGVFTIFTNDNSDQFILYADSVNGLLLYTQSTDTWAVAGGITGLPGGGVTDIRFVTSHKQRIWLIRENDSDGYYLPINAIAGEVKIFIFGSNMTRGGDLAGLYNWTRDGGDGVDDFLLAIGRGGDVIVYRGSDPGFASSWDTAGTWNVGHIPAGRRVATDYGGDVWILSTYGVISAAELFRGQEAAALMSGVSGKIAQIIRNRMKTELDSIGWELRMHPNNGEMIINSPFPSASGVRPLQYILNVNVKGWGFWRDLDMETFEVWNDRLYSVDDSGSVWNYENGPDNVTLVDASTNAVPIEFSLLSSYQALGSPGRYKIVEFLRPIYSSKKGFTSRALAIADYLVGEPSFSGDVPDVAGSGGVWDASNWDKAVWGGAPNPFIDLEGGSGLGLSFAIALQGDVFAEVILVSTGISWRDGGNL